MIVFDSIQLDSTLHVWNDTAYKYTHGEEHVPAFIAWEPYVGSTLLERMGMNGLNI